MRKKWRKLFRTVKYFSSGGKIQGYNEESIILGNCFTKFPTWRHLGHQGGEDEQSEAVKPRGGHV